MTPVDLAALKADLSRDEGIRYTVYDDATGYPVTKGGTFMGHPTIGIGHNLDARGLCDAAIDAQYQLDVKILEEQITHALPWTNSLDGPRWRVLLNIGFNVGTGGLLQFKNMLVHLQAGRYAEAAAEIDASQIAPTRKHALMILMQTAKG